VWNSYTLKNELTRVELRSCYFQLKKKKTKKQKQQCIQVTGRLECKNNRKTMARIRKKRPVGKRSKLLLLFPPRN
jgi:hypothetical protein